MVSCPLNAVVNLTHDSGTLFKKTKHPWNQQTSNIN